MSQTGQSDDQSISSQVHKIIDDLIAFDKDSRVRIYRTVGTFFGFDGVEPPRPGGADAPPTPPGASREPHFSSPPEPSPKEFLFEKRPSTDVDRVACLAYFLTHYRGNGPRPVGFAASGGNATKLAAVRGVGPRRVSLMAAAPSPGPRGLAPPRGTGAPRSRQTQRSASEPAGPTVAADDAPTSCRHCESAMGALNSDMLCTGPPGRRVAPRAPRFRPPHSHRDRRCDADKSARGQPRHAATSPTARFISAHFHWRNQSRTR